MPRPDRLCRCGHPYSDHNPDTDIGCTTQPALCWCYEFTPLLTMVTNEPA